MGVAVDGNKSEVIRKLKSKGFKAGPFKEDVLSGQFNGTTVNVFLSTNESNKVWRIEVVDANTLSEEKIKTRFNKLCKQFQGNKSYLPMSDSTIKRYMIPEGADISKEISVKKKRYEAIFYQKPTDFDSLVNERTKIVTKKSFQKEDEINYKNIMRRLLEAYESGMVVWFTILKVSDGYQIAMFFENRSQKPNGAD